jgi:hypothetical protein
VRGSPTRRPYHVTKPVSRVLYRAFARRWPSLLDAPCGAPRATNPGGSSGNETGRSPCRAAPIRSCSRWGLPCHPCYQGRGALLPHPFTLTARSVSGLRGGLLSVALSLGSPPPDIIRHRASVEPGLSSPPSYATLAERPSGLLTEGNKGFVACRVKHRRSPWIMDVSGRGLSSARNGILIFFCRLFPYS